MIDFDYTLPLNLALNLQKFTLAVDHDNDRDRLTEKIIEMLYQVEVYRRDLAFKPAFGNVEGTLFKQVEKQRLTEMKVPLSQLKDILKDGLRAYFIYKYLHQQKMAHDLKFNL